MLIYYVGDFENGIGDRDLARRLWRGMMRLLKIDKSKPIEVVMCDTYCLMLHRDADDGWAGDCPLSQYAIDEVINKDSIKTEVVVTPSSDKLVDFELILNAMSVAFNKYSVKTLMSLHRDWLANRE